MLLADRYRVVHRLGSGGMATVFLCEDEVLDRKVAVKRLHGYDDPDQLRRFRREARVGAALSHPNLVTVYDTIDDEGGALIVMEYVEGPTLAAALADGPLQPERATAILAGVAAALDHAHAHGVVHRDVKPANVLLAGGEQAKLADLGIASASHLTQTVAGETIVGTLAYMAPERLQGNDSGAAGDVYALGSMAFETLSGARANRASTPAEALAEALRGEPPDLREGWAQAPPEAAAAITAAMSPDPSERPRSAGELVARLAGALDTREVAPTAATVPIGGGGAGFRRYRGPLIAAAAVLLLAGIVLAATSSGGGGGDNRSAGSKQQPSTPTQTPPPDTTVTQTQTVQAPEPVTTAPEPKPKPPKKEPKPPKDEKKPPKEDKKPPGQAKKDEHGHGGEGGD